MKVLITGAGGYLGKILGLYLESKNHQVLRVDRISAADVGAKSAYVQCDLATESLSSKISNKENIDAVIDLATEIDFAVNSQRSLYRNNTACVENILNFCKERSINKYIYTSSNSVYLGNQTNPIREEDSPLPTDAYGKSKYDSEQYLLKNSGDVGIDIVRCPNIIDAGRVGMLSILFELLQSDATLWVIGKGNIRHQCIYAQDLCDAIEKLLFYKGSITLNIGSDNVPSFADMFARLASYVGSRSKIRGLPAGLVVPMLKLLYKAGLSPMGPYQFRMLTREFIFDTSRIRKELGWSPTKTNAEMMEVAYDFYIKNKEKAVGSANSAPVNMGVLSLLKFIKF